MKTINLEINNIHRYIFAALIVDRDEFLSQIDEIRQQLDLSELIPSDQLNDWLRNYNNNWIKHHPEEAHRATISYFRPAIVEQVSIATALDKAVRSLRKQLKQTGMADKIIRSAILTGSVIEEGNRLSAKPQVIYPEFVNLKFQAGENEPQCAIYYSPFTPKADLEAVLDDAITLQDFYKKHILKIPSISLRARNNFRRDRKLYWLRKNGMTSEEIQANPALNPECLTVETIERYYFRYQKLLSSQGG